MEMTNPQMFGSRPIFQSYFPAALKIINNQVTKT